LDDEDLFFVGFVSTELWLPLEKVVGVLGVVCLFGIQLKAIGGVICLVLGGLGFGHWFHH